jgi:hypothetical protein
MSLLTRYVDTYNGSKCNACGKRKDFEDIGGFGQIYYTLLSKGQQNVDGKKWELTEDCKEQTDLIYTLFERVTTDESSGVQYCDYLIQSTTINE